MNKKTITLMLGVSAVLMGCSTTNMNSPISGTGLSVERLNAISRPHEYGIKSVADSAQSEAVSTKILGIRVQGKNVSLNAPILGHSLQSSAQSEALANILESNQKIDGLIVTHSTIERTEFPPYIPILFSREKAKVKVKPFVIEDHGTITAERADKLSASCSPEKNEAKPKGLLDSLFNLF